MLSGPRPQEFMETYYEIKPGLCKGSAVALGFFDGVHLGHQAVITQAVAEAKRLGLPSALATFRDHPREIISGTQPALLTTFEQRLEFFQHLGVDLTLAIAFTPELSRLSPVDYVKTVLLDCLGARSVSIGYNHHLGRNREGNPEMLRQLGQKLNFDVHVLPEVFVDSVEVSSSKIREYVKVGDMPLAAKLLGRPYMLAGTVIQGQGRGRGIGFPTANLSLPPNQLLPERGVYAGVTRLPQGPSLPCVINLGFRPTLTDAAVFSAEVHILDFNQNIYGLPIKVEFWQRLRAEEKFASLDALKAQIGSDCLKAKELLPAACGYSSFEPKLPA